MTAGRRETEVVVSRRQVLRRGALAGGVVVASSMLLLPREDPAWADGEALIAGETSPQPLEIAIATVREELNGLG